MIWFTNQTDLVLKSMTEQLRRAILSLKKQPEFQFVTHRKSSSV